MVDGSGVEDVCELAAVIPRTSSVLFEFEIEIPVKVSTAAGTDVLHLKSVAPPVPVKVTVSPDERL
jgi:hypothetical protein